MIAKAIYSILGSNEAAKAIADNRFYPGIAPDGAVLPYAVFNTISRVPNANKSRLKEIEVYRLQVDCYGETYDDAMGLADAVNDALSFYSGTAGEVDIDIIVFENENDTIEPDTEVYRVSQDFKIRRRN